jgi:hypothetical protein
LRFQRQDPGMYFRGEPLHTQVLIVLLVPSVGVSVSVPPAAAASLLLVVIVTVITPLAPTFVVATNCVAAAEPLHPACVVVDGQRAGCRGELGDAGLACPRRRRGLGNASADREVLIRRQGDGGKNADDRDHDHQLDQREALLEFASWVALAGVECQRRNRRGTGYPSATIVPARHSRRACRRLWRAEDRPLSGRKRVEARCRPSAAIGHSRAERGTRVCGTT